MFAWTGCACSKKLLRSLRPERPISHDGDPESNIRHVLEQPLKLGRFVLALMWTPARIELAWLTCHWRVQSNIYVPAFGPQYAAVRGRDAWRRQ